MSKREFGYIAGGGPLSGIRCERQRITPTGVSVVVLLQNAKAYAIGDKVDLSTGEFKRIIDDVSVADGMLFVEHVVRTNAASKRNVPAIVAALRGTMNDHQVAVALRNATEAGRLVYLGASGGHGSYGIPVEVPCDVCRGTGKIVQPDHTRAKCPTCNGSMVRQLTN